MIPSLQGCLVVGKTTAVRYLQEHAPEIHISYEDNSDVIAQIKARNLDKTKYENYLEMQRLWHRKAQPLEFTKSLHFSFGKIDKTLLQFVRISGGVLCVLSRVMSVRKIAWRGMV
ncbi:MAG: hypothetical protein IJV82_04505 [Oscillospiraceae bacterium]|nr:hypothetical protein [Oscillospiraceae bacterium]